MSVAHIDFNIENTMYINRRNVHIETGKQKDDT